MAPRPKPAINKPTRGVEKKTAVDADLLPHLADLIDYGEITIGTLEPVGCVATAVDGYNCLAMLVRRDGETLMQLLQRLGQAVALAFTEDIFTDEVNTQPEALAQENRFHGSPIPLIQVVSKTRIMDTTTDETDQQSGHAATLTLNLLG